MDKRIVFFILFIFTVWAGSLNALSGNACAAGKEGKALLPGSSLLLIPDGANNRVMGFDPLTGNLVDPDVIPSDPANLQQPWHAILSADGNSILVSDSTLDVVQEYNLDGSYIGVFAPAGGANTTILDYPLGMALKPDGNLLVTVNSGTNIHSIAEFNSAGTYVGNFVDGGAGGLTAPSAILLRSAQSDYLVSGYHSSAILQYDLSGAYVGVFAAISNSHPGQIIQAANGNYLVTCYDGAYEGVVELNPAGDIVNVYNPAGVGGNVGVYELPNGNILTSNFTGVYEINRSGVLVDTKISGVEARHIQFAQVLSKTGFWWVPGQTGRAISIEIQGGHLAIGWGAYDDSGVASWMFSDGDMSSATTYSGILYSYSGGSCFDCPYHTYSGQKNEGSISIIFTSNTTAQLNALGVIQNIQRIVFQ